MSEVADISMDSVADMSPEQATGTIEQLKSDDGFRAKLFNNTAPGNKHVTGLWDALHQKANGAETIAPANTAAPEGRLDYSDAVPAQPDGYVLNLPDMFAAGSEEGNAEVCTVAHALGASHRDVNDLFNMAKTLIGAGVAQSPDKRAQATAKTEQRLRAEWPDFDNRLARTQRFIKEKGNADFNEFLNITGLIEQESTVRRLYELAVNAGY